MEKRTTNPVFRHQVRKADFVQYGKQMTVSGTVGKTAILLLVLIVAFAYTWMTTQDWLYSQLNSFMTFAGIATFILALISVFVPKITRYTGILYAALEGAFLGSFTYFVNQSYPGIALQAVLITFAVFFTMLVLFVTRLVRVTESMRAIIMGATFGIMIFYLISFVLDLFGVSIPLFTSSSLLSIGFSLFVAGIAAFGFLIDFDNVERMSQSNMPKYYEWYGAFGILVSLVWLYIEILNLLMKLKDR